ncbi:hypothetical protein BR93DRAFT_963458 [Coniochaeta sp. PMI_546]|nr:hypothetical protein BR93DRAFT_963458 [Coniochaeta sp. PMI_546]
MTITTHATGAVAHALCINQKDKQERGQQVTMMGSIYLRARLDERTCVLQEVGLSRNPRVICDDADFSYHDLIDAVKCLTLYDSELAARMGILSLIVHTLWKDGSES